MTRLPNGRRLLLHYCPDVYTRSGRVKATYKRTSYEWNEFRRLEAALIKEKPHLAEQQFCGLAPET